MKVNGYEFLIKHGDPDDPIVEYVQLQSHGRIVGDDYVGVCTLDAVKNTRAELLAKAKSDLELRGSVFVVYPDSDPVELIDSVETPLTIYGCYALWV